MPEPLTARWFQQIAERHFDLNYTEKQLTAKIKGLNKVWRPKDDSESMGNKMTRLKIFLSREAFYGKPTPRPQQQHRPNMWIESDGCKVLYRVGMTGVVSGSNALSPGGESAYREWEDNTRFIESERLNEHP